MEFFLVPFVLSGVGLVDEDRKFDTSTAGDFFSNAIPVRESSLEFVLYCLDNLEKAFGFWFKNNRVIVKATRYLLKELLRRKVKQTFGILFIDE